MAHPRGGYKNKSGQKIPGVTTIIGRFKDSGGLMYWAFEQGKAAERGEIEKLYDKRDEAAVAGTIAHSMVEATIRRDPLPDISMHPENIQKHALQGYENYLRWSQNSKIEVIYQEIQLVSEKHQFGGCPDAIIIADGKLAVGDWKTSDSVYPDYLIQLSAYKKLWEENFPDQPITGGFHLCRFGKKHADFAHFFWHELDDAWELFLLYRRAYDLYGKLKKRV
ncbi:MAG: hypothetical protein GF313_08965 [Caldithrix sp.]|nr:hypothetical protein [Caldithrix sp.]